MVSCAEIYVQKTDRKLLTKLTLAIPPADIRDAVLFLTRDLAFKSITLNFASQVPWNIPALVDDIVEWLNGPQFSTIAPSKVGTLSSPNFMALIESHVGVGSMLNFQRMLYAESLAHLRPTAEDQQHLSTSELCQIGAAAGHSFLNFLDKKLRPESLKSGSHEYLQTLFLLIVGTILAVGYTSPGVTNSKSFGEVGVRINSSSHTRIDFLCSIQMTVFRGTKLNCTQCKIICVKF
jgi:hypothetical protein